MKKRVEVGEIITYSILIFGFFILFFFASNIIVFQSQEFNKIFMIAIAIGIYTSFALYVMLSLKKNGKETKKKKRK